MDTKYETEGTTTLTLNIWLPHRNTNEGNTFQRAWLMTHFSTGSPLPSTSCSEAVVGAGGSSGSSTHKSRWRCKLPLPCSSNLYQ